jgi:aryl-phospho-beta-D-glucosidase BglC (GH1 family)
MQHFQNGVNLGGWLSQYRRYEHDHFRTFITRRDIEQIAAWGFDHIRLPVDYPVLESDEAALQNLLKSVYDRKLFGSCFNERCLKPGLTHSPQA